MTSDPDVLFFGCWDVPGHFLYGKQRKYRYEETPWGIALDSGLLCDKAQYGRIDCSPSGAYVEAHKDGWSAVAFWDRSGDRRAGSNSAFIVAANLSAAEVLRLAREQWPEIFARPNFPLK